MRSLETPIERLESTLMESEAAADQCRGWLLENPDAKYAPPDSKPAQGRAVRLAYLAGQEVRREQYRDAIALLRSERRRTKILPYPTAILIGSLVAGLFVRNPHTALVWIGVTGIVMLVLQAWQNIVGNHEED